MASSTCNTLEEVLRSEEAVHGSIEKVLKAFNAKYEAAPPLDVATLMYEMHELKIHLKSLIRMHTPMVEQPHSTTAPTPGPVEHQHQLQSSSEPSPASQLARAPSLRDGVAPVSSMAPQHVEPLAPAQLSVVAIGNPGTGKSTFLNCLLGKANFASGLSYGGGLTKQASETISGNVTYADTPGLADQVIEKVAASEITRALRCGGAFKLLFFVRLQAGRLVTDDLVTIQRVLSTIHADVMDAFSVVINNVPPMIFQTLSRRGPEFERVMEHFNSMTYVTQHIVFNPTSEALNEQDNAVVQLPQHVTDFIHHAPTIFLQSNQVGEIDTSDYRAEVDQLRDKIEAQLRKNEMLSRQIGQTQPPQDLRSTPVAYARPVPTRQASMPYARPTLHEQSPAYVTVTPSSSQQPTMSENPRANPRPRKLMGLSLARLNR